MLWFILLPMAFRTVCIKPLGDQSPTLAATILQVLIRLDMRAVWRERGLV